VPARWSFASHISPILTFAGCNQAACHGSPVGKNGFKLSLYGQHPEKDYAAIAEKRLDRAAPARSLLYLKPTMGVAHGGGRRFAKESPEARVLLAWIEAGAPMMSAGAAVLKGLDVTPPYRVLRKPGETMKLAVSAVYSDGTREDVTARSIFSSNDEAVLKVESGAVARAAGSVGEAAITARYGGLMQVATYGASTLAAVKASAAPAGLVDREVYAKLAQLNIVPSEPAGDEEFIRRLYLDVLGVLPTPGEVRIFVSSKEPAKRAWLIDQVLERPEYADLQTLLWADRLRSDSRFHRVGGVRSYYKWLREEFAANRPLDKFARSLLTATGANYTNGPANYWGNYDKISTPVEVAIQTGQLFLGVRAGCAQCHDHPFEKWTQDDFYSLAAVFSQVVEFHTKNVQEFDLRLSANRAVLHPVSKQPVEPRYFGAGVIETTPGEDRRVAFAKWLTAKENPYFARAMANLIWRNLMGRGLIHPVDDRRDSNPATHEALLEALAGELAGHGFDQKHLMRLILNSRTYQHSSKANETNKLDFKYYSRAYPKRLPAEVYMDAVAQVTGVPDTFAAWPEAKRSVQLPDNRMNLYVLEVFQRNTRLQICDREEDVTPSQGLNLINGQDLQKKLAHADGRLTQWLGSGKTDSELIEEIYLATLSRRPTAQEKDRMLTRAGAAKSRREIFEDMLWAALSSREFVFNH